MNYLYSVLLGFAMSIDCMCVGANDGIIESNMKKRKVFFIAFLFGFMQGIMPLIGYILGSFINKYIEKYIPYISFAILFILGIKSIIEAIIERRRKDKEVTNREKTLSILEIFVQSIATSIDALTIGLTFLPANDRLYPYLTFIIISIITFSLSLLTIFLGKKIGSKVEKYAPFIAGTIFILLAIKFLIQGLI